MKVELRGTIRVALGAGTVEVDVPPEGLSLGQVLGKVREASPRASRALLDAGHGRVLRVVHNETVVDRGQDPLIRDGDRLLLLVAVAGG